jgi:hypothetical protein
MAGLRHAGGASAPGRSGDAFQIEANEQIARVDLREAYA